MHLLRCLMQGLSLVLLKKLKGETFGYSRTVLSPTSLEPSGHGSRACFDSHRRRSEPTFPLPPLSRFAFPCPAAQPFHMKATGRSSNIETGGPICPEAGGHFGPEPPNNFRRLFTHYNILIGRDVTISVGNAPARDFRQKTTKISDAFRRPP